MRRTLIAGFALVIVVSACGDDDAVPASSSVPTPTTSPTTTAVVEQSPQTSVASATTSTTAPPSAVTTRPPVTTTTQIPTTTTTEPPTSTQALADLNLTSSVVARGLERPVFLTAPRGDNRLFVVEQPGRILVIEDGSTEVFLDIRDRVRSGGEQGLLGLAFHPGYFDSRRFFVNYTDASGTTVISEFQADPVDPNRSDPATEKVLLTVAQPAANHNGGMIAFGPDGYLYIGFGDGGGSADQFRQAQRPDTLLGTISRIDVDSGDPYGIPPENPFAAREGGAPEVWAWGMRNPWRFSFDGERIYVGDVGQNRSEEINIVTVGTPGVNMGWPITEGFECFRADSCDRTDLLDPVFTYPHENNNCSVTGGYVYRGTAIPDLVGAYLFGDFCSGQITGFRVDGEGVYQVRDWTDDLRTPRLTSFGRDGFGELYLIAQTGEIARITGS